MTISLSKIKLLKNFQIIENDQALSILHFLILVALKRSVFIIFLVLMFCEVPFILDHCFPISWHAMHKMQSSLGVTKCCHTRIIFSSSSLLLDGFFFSNDAINSLP